MLEPKWLRYARYAISSLLLEISERSNVSLFSLSYNHVQAFLGVARVSPRPAPNPRRAHVASTQLPARSVAAANNNKNP